MRALSLQTPKHCADETMFVGLPLDDENQVELAEAYIKEWCDQIMREFGLK